ncbi:hypothetical protein [Actinocorallia populi]|uniref:hypothetical protein n=1 Tax=Actinocorallia populi TaxID=2079200 RepID=UPI000D091678|nr:hypothetical protein [Actinocorallia populi]
MSKTTETEEALEGAEALETGKAQAGKAEAEKPEVEKPEVEKAEAGKPEAGEPEAEESPVEIVAADESAARDTDEDEKDGALPAAKDGGAKDGEPAKRGLRDRLNGGVVGVLALIALVASLATSAFLWTSYSGASEELDTQQQVRTRSAEFSRAFLLYEKSDLQGWEKRLTALAAPDYRNAIGQAVKMQFPVITSLEASSDVTVREVFLNDFDGTVAKAMVVADTQVNSKEFVRTVTGMRLLVELNQVKGEWLVSGVGVLGIDNETMTDHEGNEVDPSKVEVPEVAPTGAP